MSRFSISRWRPAHLFLAWIGYWAALLILAVGPAIPAIIRATSANRKGEVSASFGDSALSLIVKEAGRVTWSGSVQMLTAVLWLGLPPLLLWALWVATRSSAPSETVGAAR